MNRVTTRADATVVHLEPWDSLDAALGRFKKKCLAAQIFQELKKRAAYLPPGVRRRAKSQRAAARRARAARRRLENGLADVDWKPERA
jgi:small subunit ribosomal protein S21